MLRFEKSEQACQAMFRCRTHQDLECFVTRLQKCLPKVLKMSRSVLLADMHRDDPEGFDRMPCDTKTWTSWLTDDTSQMNADRMDGMLTVIRVWVLYIQNFWIPARAARSPTTLGVIPCVTPTCGNAGIGGQRECAWNYTSICDDNS
jgi:hypothetical protein